MVCGNLHGSSTVYYVRMFVFFKTAIPRLGRVEEEKGCSLIY